MKLRRKGREGVGGWDQHVARYMMRWRLRPPGIWRPNMLRSLPATLLLVAPEIAVGVRTGMRRAEDRGTLKRRGHVAVRSYCEGLRGGGGSVEGGFKGVIVREYFPAAAALQ